jgi:hypothetical protein
MPRYGYERLSAEDTSFLMSENANQPMHVAALQVLEAGDLKKDDGGIDVDRYKRAIASVLHRIPRYRRSSTGSRSRTGRSGSTIDTSTSTITFDIRHFCVQVAKTNC